MENKEINYETLYINSIKEFEQLRSDYSMLLESHKEKLEYYKSKYEELLNSVRKFINGSSIVNEILQLERDYYKTKVPKINNASLENTTDSIDIIILQEIV